MDKVYKIGEKAISTAGNAIYLIKDEIEDYCMYINPESINQYDKMVDKSIDEFRDSIESVNSLKYEASSQTYGTSIIDETGIDNEFPQLFELVSTSHRNVRRSEKLLFDIPCAMGIINVTPDSFSDGGKFLNQTDAINYGVGLIDKGIDIIDIGGESTRPGAELISYDEEIQRVIPIVEGILQLRPEAVISLDTNKSKVAEEGLKKGCLIINDISGGQYDEDMFNVIAKYNAAIVIMHTRSIPKNMQNFTGYSDIIEEISEYFRNRISEAKKAGVKSIILDPGIGFAKTMEQNYSIIKNLNCFQSLDYPLMIGLSRKSFIGNSLGLDVKERDFPTSIIETIAIKNGAAIVRTHNSENILMVKNIFKHLMNNQNLIDGDIALKKRETINSDESEK